MGIAAVLTVAVLLIWRTVGRELEDRRLEKLRTDLASDSGSRLTRLDLPNGLEDEAMARAIAKVDPQQDAWQTEVISQGIARQLKRISQMVAQRDAAAQQQDVSATIFADQFQLRLDVDGDRSLQRDGPLVQVIRAAGDGSGSEFTGDVDQLLRQWRPAEASLIRCATKVIGIRTEQEQASADVLVEILQQSQGRLVQRNLTATTQWTLQPADAPQLMRWETVRLEQVQLATDRPLFEEVTESVLGMTTGYQEQVLRGLDYWSQRLTGLDDMHIYGHHGMAVGDVNGDGLEDLYVCDSGGLPNRLFVQQPDGTVRDVAEAYGVDWLESTTSALLIDLDNDGDQDLVAATIAALLIAENTGRGTFRIRDALAGIPEAHTMCAADYDNDGDLDIYVTNYGPAGSSAGSRGFEASVPIPYNDANNGGRNLLLANEGAFRFRDVTSQVGLDHNNRRWSFAAAWEDYDQDGDMDLYVANDFGRNNLYRNDSGRFRDVAAKAGVEDVAGGMSATWGDSNQDGRMDIYVGNMFSAAGRRVTYQRQFTAAHSRNRAQAIQRMARGNTLFVATPDGNFQDASDAAGVTMGRWAWGSKFLDIDNDGRQDLIVANGYFTSEKTDDL